MPVVFRSEGFRFHFYSDEGNPRESIHIHVAQAGADAKFWLFPEVLLAYNRGFDARTIRRLQDIVSDHRSEIEEAWNEYFG
ncbi:DUF4160 domain-containing protein [Methylovirgula sp. 4M-Z18]|uniref:DUF4160 domain-containing protein n=1 Tax=Methylovirgula sp. 4M-Z18 TaxID=2293567 RepID=UPI000E2F3591|nr:DUF4160 domain-containing protein [Methylovirgula sp. 4M-Z18]RFB80191.1 DUF4160 domain-containing protein [Methylovirgula sp. 4M-Z18]